MKTLDLTESMRDPICACQSCDWTGPVSALDEAYNLWDRLSPGDVFPMGDCPECGAFCHEEKDAGVVAMHHLGEAGKRTRKERDALRAALLMFVAQYEGNGHDEREQRPEMKAARAALAGKTVSLPVAQGAVIENLNRINRELLAALVGLADECNGKLQRNPYSVPVFKAACFAVCHAIGYPTEGKRDRSAWMDGIDRARALLADPRSTFATKPLKVLIEVEGGCADVTTCPAGVEVEIVDHDNAKVGL